MKKQNHYIELLRFVFCILLFVHHSGSLTGESLALVPSGGLLADVFFVLTGYFTFRHVENRFFSGAAAGQNAIGETAGYSVKYTLKKILKIYPYIVFGALAVFVYRIIVLIGKNMVSIGALLEQARATLIDLTLLLSTGCQKVTPTSIDTFNAPTWYMSALLIALPVLIYLLIRRRNVVRHYLVWLLPPALIALSRWLFGSTVQWSLAYGPLHSSVIRAFTSLFLGGAVYYSATFLANKFGEKMGEKKGLRVLLTVAELVLLAGVFIAVIHGVPDLFVPFAIYLAATSLTLCFSGLTYTSSLGIEKLDALGKLSMPIYCIHWPVYMWTRSIAIRIGISDWQIQLPIAFALTILLSIALVLFSEKVLFRKRDKNGEEKAENPIKTA